MSLLKHTCYGINRNFLSKKNCAKCGACVVVCPVYQITGKEINTARGKLHLLQTWLEKGLEIGKLYEDGFAQCLLCGACSAVCSREIDIRTAVITQRAQFPLVYGDHGCRKHLMNRVLANENLLSLLTFFMGKTRKYLVKKSVKKSVDDICIFSKKLPRLQNTVNCNFSEVLQMWTIMPHSCTPVRRKALSFAGGVLQKSYDDIYFAGCTAKHIYPHIADKCIRMFGTIIGEKNVCCGKAALSSGDFKRAISLAKTNITAFEEHDGFIFTSCSACYSHLSEYPRLFAMSDEWYARAMKLKSRLVELSKHLAVSRFLESEKKQYKVYYHEPCNLRHGTEIVDEHKNVIKKTPNVELLELLDGSLCCGRGGLFHIGSSELSLEIRNNLADRVFAMEPDIITTTCSSCLMQWKEAVKDYNINNIKVLHLAELTT